MFVVRFMSASSMFYLYRSPASFEIFSCWSSCQWTFYQPFDLSNIIKYQKFIHVHFKQQFNLSNKYSHGVVPQSLWFYLVLLLNYLFQIVKLGVFCQDLVLPWREMKQHFTQLVAIQKERKRYQSRLGKRENSKIS